ASTSASYREYYSSEATSASVRPMLTVVYGGSTVPPPVGQPPSGSVTTLRVLQYNTHHGGYGTDDVYSPARIVDQIVKATPDIVSMQEIEVNTSWSQGKDQRALYKALLEQRTGATWYMVWFGRSGSTTGLGEMILSRYPFVATSHVLLAASRSAVDATIMVNGRTINFTSVH